MNNQPLSPQGYNINNAPVNTNPFWEDGEGGGNVPAGGEPGQVLTKRTAADYDTEWKTPETGTEWPAGGIDGDLLVKFGTDARWKTPGYATTAELEEVQHDADDAAQAAADAAQAAADEKSRAEVAERALQQAIEEETGRATTAENNLGNRINTVVNDLSDIGDDLRAEEARAESAEQNLQDAITAEAERAGAAERALQQSFASLDNDLSTETQNRIDADSLLRDDITQAQSDILQNTEDIVNFGSMIEALKEQYPNLIYPVSKHIRRGSYRGLTANAAGRISGTWSGGYSIIYTGDGEATLARSNATLANLEENYFSVHLTPGTYVFHMFFGPGDYEVGTSANVSNRTNILYYWDKTGRVNNSVNMSNQGYFGPYTELTATINITTEDDYCLRSYFTPTSRATTISFITWLTKS